MASLSRRRNGTVTARSGACNSGSTSQPFGLEQGRANHLLAHVRSNSRAMHRPFARLVSEDVRGRMPLRRPKSYRGGGLGSNCRSIPVSACCNRSGQQGSSQGREQQKSHAPGLQRTAGSLLPHFALDQHDWPRRAAAGARDVGHPSEETPRCPDCVTNAPHRIWLCRVMRNRRRQFGGKSGPSGSGLSPAEPSRNPPGWAARLFSARMAPISPRAA